MYILILILIMQLYINEVIMKKTLYEYKDKIKKLPIKDKYLKNEILIEDFLIDKENNIEIYYAPHNEYLNLKRKFL